MFGNDPTIADLPAVGTAMPPAPPKKRSLTWLWITLAVVAALVVACVGVGVYALAQLGAPAAAASQFCAELKTQNYDTAYGMLSAKLKAAYSNTQFDHANEALDAAEGKVTACGAGSGSNAYSYTLGSDHATVVAVVTRATQGPLQGGVHLVSESGAWKVDAMDTSLLGINLGALQTLGAFCQAEQTQDYTTMFGLLSTSLQNLEPQAQFAVLAPLQDAIDGKVTACAIKSIPGGNTDTSAMVTVTVTRATLGTSTGMIKLEATSSGWKISQIDQSVQGTNIQPLAVGTLFCVFVSTSDFSDAYSLLSSGVQQSNTQAKLQAAFTLPSGYKWLAQCHPDMSTYQVTANSAQYSGVFLYSTPSNATGEAKISFTFVLEGTAWKIDSVSWSA